MTLALRRPVNRLLAGCVVRVLFRQVGHGSYEGSTFVLHHESAEVAHTKQEEGIITARG